MSERRIVSVSRLVGYMKASLEADPVLSGVLVEGEISNLRKPYSGHWYFSLKDENASLSCVMFASSNRRVTFSAKNGDKVVVRGSVSVYPAQGSMQLIVSAMRQSGIGDLYQRLELLKKKLAAEGLFDERHKKKLPPYPMNIALVTGSNTAAREDVLITFAKRWPIASVAEYPAPVQGADAPPKIIDALQKADRGGHELILLVRGGGSIEDLWCFNDESLARFIYGMNTPVVTGIGHEIDFTLADFTADVRANTPTGAVEASVPDIAEVHANLSHLRKRIAIAAQRRLKNDRDRLSYYAERPVMQYPERLYSQQAMRLDYLREKLMSAQKIPEMKRAQFSMLARKLQQNMHECTKEMRTGLYDEKLALTVALKHRMMISQSEVSRLKDALNAAIMRIPSEKTKQLAAKAALLDAFSPLKVMSRGYSIAFKDDTVIRSAADVKENDRIRIRLEDGLIHALTERTEVTDVFSEQKGKDI